ncbi:exodeoxyribonuclease VII small subunit [Thalassolituus sp.]|jgi:exodeoxyribonuclease VII small subunit|uniref:exodeoxyribonuclease VII small subunit n=1 Tax=Thalassolituus sp. TaxID=2030822 RepID=UPI002617B85D|nr:exodeoxyribonuclease VII small subunit [uncultured Thalassolituus sp.]TNC92921.1 MAG: exodeoxyribonuclease VII small subunit [Thalassolituus sp.]
MTEKTPPFEFESALAELEALVNRMESGELSLEDSLAAFERGIGLTRQCQTALSEAEQRVQILMERNGVSEGIPFNAEPGE